MAPDERAILGAAARDRGDRLALLVLADYLDERGDPRAAGYRALAADGVLVRPLAPYLPPHAPTPEVHWYALSDGTVDPESDLPPAWFAALAAAHRPGTWARDYRKVIYLDFPSAYWAATAAYAGLDPAARARVAEELAGHPLRVARPLE